MILLPWIFRNTSSQRKRVPSAARNARLSITLLLCFTALLLFVGCKEQNPPRLPNKKTPEMKAKEQARLNRYLNEMAEAKGLTRSPTIHRIEQGLKWLVEQQAEDGGWHSQTYGNLKGGAATTALALYTISQYPEENTFLQLMPRKNVGLASDFLAPGLAKKGFVVCPDGSMDEPTYATALYTLAIYRMQLPVTIDIREQMYRFLTSEQCSAARGIAKDDPNYGGWDLAGGAGLQGETPGTNISITRFVTQTFLCHSAFSLSSYQQSRILDWAARVQNFPGDGGFFFHPESDHLGNKAEWTDGEEHKQPRSYGTATCDGILLLAALDVPAEDPRMQAAVGWLLDHPAVDHVPGFEDAPAELDWQHGLHFYYLMTLAEALPHFPAEKQATLRNAIRQQLLSMQQADGSWKNPSARMREDDPLIATCFALIALSNLIAN